MTIGVLTLLAVAIFRPTTFRFWACRKRRGGRTEPAWARAMDDIVTYGKVELHANEQRMLGLSLR